MHAWPDIADWTTFATWRADPARWLPAALDVARGHGLAVAEPHVFAAGTNLVVALGPTLVLKIFPPFARAQFASERASLLQLRGRTDVPIPSPVAEGERDGWPNLVMTRLAGVPGEIAWSQVPDRQKEAILRQLGETIAQVQAAPPGDLVHVEPGWRAFIEKQVAGCRARHVRLGLPAPCLAGLDDLLREATTLVPLDAPPVILTGEYIPENLLMAEGPNGWRLAGLFDFGDAMTGWGEYDLLGPSAFMAAGVRGRVLRLLDGFGAAERGPALRRRLLILMLLHRASDPVRHVAIPGWPDKVGSLDELERLVWPI